MLDAQLPLERHDFRLLPLVLGGNRRHVALDAAWRVHHLRLERLDFGAYLAADAALVVMAGRQVAQEARGAQVLQVLLRLRALAALCAASATQPILVKSKQTVWVGLNCFYHNIYLNNDQN